MERLAPLHPAESRGQTLALRRCASSANPRPTSKADDGSGTVNSAAQELTSGYGLAGLHERIKLMDGEISTGPLDGGGYSVRVTLPAVSP